MAYGARARDFFLSSTFIEILRTNCPHLVNVKWNLIKLGRLWTKISTWWSYQLDEFELFYSASSSAAELTWAWMDAAHACITKLCVCWCVSDTHCVVWVTRISETKYKLYSPFNLYKYLCNNPSNRPLRNIYKKKWDSKLDIGVQQIFASQSQQRQVRAHSQLSKKCLKVDVVGVLDVHWSIFSCVQDDGDAIAWHA